MKYDIIFIRSDKVVAKGKSVVIPGVWSKVFVNGELLRVSSVTTKTYIRKRLFGYSIKVFYIVDVFEEV